MGAGLAALISRQITNSRQNLDFFSFHGLMNESTVSKFHPLMNLPSKIKLPCHQKNVRTLATRI
jgi:hypothetical protein